MEHDDDEAERTGIKRYYATGNTKTHSITRDDLNDEITETQTTGRADSTENPDSDLPKKIQRRWKLYAHTISEVYAHISLENDVETEQTGDEFHGDEGRPTPKKLFLGEDFAGRQDYLHST
jgi:hypothetical protein